MNKELLSKLRKQSKVDPKEIIKAIANSESAVIEHWLEQFAETIVQECLKIAKNREDEFESAGLLSESNAVGNVAYRISRQFGVKR